MSLVVRCGGRLPDRVARLRCPDFVAVRRTFIPLFRPAERMRGEVTVSESVVNVHQESVSDNRWPPARVRALRVHVGLSQENFGKLVDVTRQTVHEWENGKATANLLNAEQLDRLAAARDFPTEWPPPLEAHMRVGATMTARLSPPVTEKPPVPYGDLQRETTRAEIRGRSIEVEALLAYALERQRSLTKALQGQDDAEAERIALEATQREAGPAPTPPTGNE